MFSRILPVIRPQLASLSPNLLLSNNLLHQKRQYSSNNFPSNVDQLEYFIREVLDKETKSIADNKIVLQNKLVKYTSYGMGASMASLWSYWFVLLPDIAMPEYLAGSMIYGSLTFGISHMALQNKALPKHKSIISCGVLTFSIALLIYLRVTYGNQY